MSKILRLIFHPNKLLRQKSQKIWNVSDATIQSLISDMIETMRRNNGIGLAAPQVGILKRLIVVGIKDDPFVIINPEIFWRSKETEVGEEGCLSIPGVFGQVKRSKEIKVKGILPSGKKTKLKAEGLFARVIQHEIDHLDGILFIDKMIKRATSNGLL